MAKKQKAKYELIINTTMQQISIVYANQRSARSEQKKWFKNPDYVSSKVVTLESK